MIRLTLTSITSAPALEAHPDKAMQRKVARRPFPLLLCSTSALNIEVSAAAPLLYPLHHPQFVLCIARSSR